MAYEKIAPSPNSCSLQPTPATTNRIAQHKPAPMTSLRSRRRSERTAAPKCCPSRAARDTESPAVISTEPARGAGYGISIHALRRLRHRTGEQAVSARRGRRARAHTSLYGFAVHALKSFSDTFGILRMNATMDQISLSFTPMAPKLGIAVILMPFLTTQKSWAGSRSWAMSFRSGGSGFKPSENFCQFTPGAPWQVVQPRSENARAPARTISGSSRLTGLVKRARRSIDAMRTLTSAQFTMPGSGALAATL